MPTHTADADPRRLPRGPHRLTREEVERSQRDRLLTGAAEAVAAKGYAATSVADIIVRAGVSRTTFYQLFDDKLDCFLASCRMASDVVLSVLADELARIEAEGVTTPTDTLDRLLRAYLQTLADFPVLARVFLVEVYAAGTPAIRQRRDSLERFVDLVAAAQRGQPGLTAGTGPDQRFAAEVLVGTVSSMVTNAVGVGESDRLPELHEPLMRLAARVLDTE
ncbi:MAG TPA: TetR/AcrR family transcriptional regulator [Acidimicrobiales bacterium]|nr:TetR/AcrR family transcriptional regulator [Acidimicrobiales bacterium]